MTRCALTADRCQIASHRDDTAQAEALTPQQMRRVCTADSVSALASNPQTAGADPAGLAWSAMCCALIYLIIIGGCADLHSVQRGAGIWYALELLRRCDVFRCGAGGAV